MTDYAHVSDGVVDQVGLPDVWTHADGSTTSNYQYAPEMFADDGWLPVAAVQPTLGANQSYGPPTYATDGTTVTATYPVIDVVPVLNPNQAAYDAFVASHPGTNFTGQAKMVRDAMLAALEALIGASG